MVMAYTEYKYPDKWIAEEVASKRASIKANLGESSDLLKNGLKVIAARIKKDPMRYRDYGCYWWSIKALLRGIGVNYGSNDDVLMRDFYTGRTPVETLVCAEAFRDEYLATTLLYSNQFVLDAGTAELVEIVDGDMEKI
jgi:hypothetical protein